MSIMAKHSQIFWARPTDADVAARNKAVDTLRTMLEEQSTLVAIRTAAAIATSIADGPLPEALATKVQTAINDESPAFVLSGNELQGTVCLAVAALVSFRDSPSEPVEWSNVDAMAAAMWSALAFQDQVEEAKLEALRQELLVASRDRVASAAARGRLRKDVPDVGTLTIDESDPTGRRSTTAYRKATGPVISALKTNQDLDREEIDFLWWVLADHSEILGCPLESKETMPRAVTAGIEGASMLRRLPGDGYRHAVLRRIGTTEDLTLAELITAIGEDRALLGQTFVGKWAAELPTVFPLLSALAGNDNALGGAAVLDARGWGSRALLEASIVAMESRFGDTK